MLAVARADGAAEALDQLGAGGYVLSTYPRVLNVESAAGRLLALHAADVPATPFSLVLAALPDAPWPPVSAAARVDGEWLHVGRLQVRLGACTAIPTAQPTGSIRDVETARRVLEPWAAESAFGAWWKTAPPPAAGFGASVASRARPAIQALSAVADDRRAARATEQVAIAGLMGLGQGATPSGDDFLLGFTAAWHWFGANPGPPAEFAALLAEQAPARTTRLAAEFYYHLAAGRASQLVERLLCSLAIGDRATMHQATQWLASYGASSGRDTISGIHAYLLARGVSDAR